MPSYKNINYSNRGMFLEHIINDTNNGEETVYGNNLVWKNVLSNYKLRKILN